MKKSIQIIALLFCTLIFAQAPEKFSYQAVVRNASNAIITSAPVGIKVSILKTSAAGTVVYAETQTATTNANGLISIQIGAGTVLSGSIAGINWDTDSYFIKTEIDPSGGSSYSIAGTTQLLSVPYALYAKNSGGGPAFTLPYVGTSAVNNTVQFRITNSSGTLNQAGYFENTNVTNSAAAITGSNNSTGAFGSGVEGRANSNTNSNVSSGVSGYMLGAGITGAGVYGYALNADGVFGISDAGSAIYGVSLGTGNGGYFQSGVTGHALISSGPLKLTSIGEGSGKVLTSDGTGNATWQDVTTPKIYLSSIGGTTQSIATSTVTKINSWTGLQEAGGANYNVATGEYTIPVTGYYSVTTQVGFTGSATSSSLAEIAIQKNGTAVKYAIGQIITGSRYPFLHATAELQLVAGDKISFAIDHIYPTSLSMQANLSGFGIHLIQK